MTIAFRDHEGFHRAASAMVIGGATAGLAAGIAGAAVAGALFAGAAGATLGVAWADRGAGSARFAARVMLLGAAWAAFALGRGAAGGHLGVVALAAVLGLALNAGVTGWRAVAAVVVGGGIAYLGGFAAGQVMIARETASLPDVIEVALAATAMSVVCVAALLPRHVEILRDPVLAAARRLPDGLEPEVRTLLARGTAVWSQVATRLDDDGRVLLRDGVLKLHDLATRWARVDAPAEDAAVLKDRAHELDGRIDAASDEVARDQYREARAAVEDQLRYVDEIHRSRERVIARLHACVTTLEKFRLAAAHLDSQHASRDALDARGAAQLLTEVSADLDACGAAIAELDGRGAAAAAAPATA